MSSSLQQKPTDSGDPSSSGSWQRWSSVATVVGTVLTLAGLVVAVLAWLRPQSPAENAKPTAGPTSGLAPTSSTGSATAPAPPPSAAGAVYLDGDGIDLVTGAANLVELPRGMSASHAIALRCPTNQGSDQASDVTFLLRGRYHRFDATVRPFYPEGAYQGSVTYVTAQIGIRQRDGTLTTTEAGSQKRASVSVPAALTATVDKAEQLKLRVECQSPRGTIVLADARLTP